MLFRCDPYFYNFKDSQSLKDIVAYNNSFKNGILIDPEILYYFVVGNYYNNLKTRGQLSNLPFKEEERINYMAISKLFDRIKLETKQIPLVFITPHIFTKFINLIWKFDKKHYQEILQLLSEEFCYINEEEVKKEEVIQFNHFKNKYLGLSETSLLLLKQRRKHPCIVSMSGKITELCKNDFLCVEFHEIVSFIRDNESKNNII